MLSAIVLSAGKSSRMGSLKSLLPLDKSTVIERILDVVLASRVDETVVVLGHQADRIRQCIAAYPVVCVDNPDGEGDMLSSVQCGIRQAAPSNGIMIVLGDQPLITVPMLNALIEEYERHSQVFVIPVHGDTRGHPMVVSPCFRDEILTQKGNGGLKEVRSRHARGVRSVSVADRALLDDMDYLGDYEEIQSRFSENN